MPSPVISPLRLKPSATVWDYLALSESDLERADVVALDTAVARGISKHNDLDAERYTAIVNAWTAEFARRLPAAEEFFWRTGPEKWHNDIRFYRMGALQSFLAQSIGVRYIEEQRKVGFIYYTNAADLFLFGLIDTRRGSCGNMATLHVAMARRMGWPVALACVNNHKVSRYDDGEVVFNIECAFNEGCDFSAGSDEDYVKRFKLPKKAIECGSDLRKLTAREMIAVFLAHRARYYRDMGKMELCDSDCNLSRVLFPNYRITYVLGMIPHIKQGEKLFNPDELGHPRSLGPDVEAIATQVDLDEGSVDLKMNVQYVVQPAPKVQTVKQSARKIISIPLVGTF